MKPSKPVSRADSSLSADARAHAQLTGAALRQARTQRGITRRQLASRLLIGVATLQRIEAGDPRASLGYYLAVGLELGVPVLASEVSPQFGAKAIAGSPRSRASRKRPGDDWFSS